MKSAAPTNALKNVTGQLLGNRSLMTTVILLIALASFEMFNYSTTMIALDDVLGGLAFMGVKWATILTIAFCGIDFAGISRLFSPHQETEDSKEVWYLFGAWLIAATMNAILTWWGVSMSVADHAMKSSAVVDPNIITNIVPVFVAVMVWITRILLIGSFSLSNQRAAGIAVRQPVRSFRSLSAQSRTTESRLPTRPVAAVTALTSSQPRTRPASQRLVPPPAAQITRQIPSRSMASRPEPEYVTEPSFSTQPGYHQLGEGRENGATWRL